jgi:hypothetical protein
MEKAQLLQRIEGSWATLDELTTGLSQPQLTTTGPEGWSVKDHLAHVAAWNLSLVALLEGRDRDAAMGVWDVPNAEVDVVNDLLHRRYLDLVVDEVEALQTGSRQMVREALAKLRDEDLSRPYGYFQPNETRPDSDRPVLEWITGNTNEHADEHVGYIRELVGATAQP